jgi:hypothetical protein
VCLCIGATAGCRYHTKITKFQGLHNLTLFFPENGGAETSRIRYIGLKGECDMIVRRSLITVAEFAANPADHKTKLAQSEGKTSTFGF